jgi:hypothetical protein
MRNAREILTLLLVVGLISAVAIAIEVSLSRLAFLALREVDAPDVAHELERFIASSVVVAICLAIAVHTIRLVFRELTRDSH